MSSDSSSQPQSDPMGSKPIPSDPTDPADVFELGNVAYKENDYVSAVKFYEQAAARGHANAMVVLGQMYHFADGVAQDYAKARELYEKAIILNHPRALNNLGFMIMNGQGAKGPPIDYGRAIHLLAMAAALGSADALNNLAHLYQQGRGFQQNYNEAHRLYEQAMDKGCVMAIENLAAMYYHGTGVTQDYAKAREYYEKAITLPCSSISQAYRQLARIYENGYGVDSNRFKAIEYLFRGYNAAKSSTQHDDYFREFARIMGGCNSQQLDRIFTGCATQHQLLTQLQQENTNFRQQIQELQTQVEFQPSGPGYEKAREDFYGRATKTAST
jgi:TPR repeat protein